MVSKADGMVNRFPKNVDGDFYTLGTRDRSGEWCGDCLACSIPEHEAPGLFAPLNDDNSDTYFVRQPETEKEITQAIAATGVCCVDAVRYGGRDRDILRRVHPSRSDYKISFSGKIILCSPSKNKWWRFWK